MSFSPFFCTPGDSTRARDKEREREFLGGGYSFSFKFFCADIYGEKNGGEESDKYFIGLVWNFGLVIAC